MFYKKIVYEALKHSELPESDRTLTPPQHINGQDSLISLMIHDIFGGEILKTHMKNSWHFYNRIDGERVDFTGSESLKPAEVTGFEDIPSTPDETSDYIDEADYTNFFMKFVPAFEEAVGLDKYIHSLST
jgi:hypothetical protein